MDNDEPSVPNEDEQLAFVIAGDNANQGSAFYTAKRYFEQVVGRTGEYKYIPLASFTHDDAWGAQLTAPYDKDRALAVVKNDQIWGVIGEFTESVQKAFKLPKFAAGFEVLLDAINEAGVSYSPLSKYPGTSRDISLKVSDEVTYESLLESVQSVLAGLDQSFTTSITPLSVYKADGATSKTITFRISLVRGDRTLKDDEVTSVMQDIAQTCSRTLDATVV